MAQGRLVNFDLIKKMGQQFGFKTFEEETIRNLMSDVKIRDGKLLLEGANALSKMGDWKLGGTVGFVKKTLDLGVSVYLSPEYSKQLDMLGGLLQDDKGRVRVNFVLGGSYENPTISNISTDNSLIKKKTEDAIKEGAKKLFDNLFKKP